ncbi:hypothetical protein [Roseibium sp. MMSF_3544]|uniref:hypothetical protein n=1 Tax=unclassified Roseibium TaxID=2629323 RepID=UPI00273F8DE2|nr:hypothetical protein [Roseibium sp. MMSF_3544]
MNGAALSAVFLFCQQLNLQGAGYGLNQQFQSRLQGLESTAQIINQRLTSWKNQLISIAKSYRLESSIRFGVKRDSSLSPLICTVQWETLTGVFEP